MANIVSTDPVSDMLTRVRNAIAVRKSVVAMPHSKAKQAVAEVLKASKFIDDVRVSGEGTTKTLEIVINEPMTSARITEIKTLSTPGRRLYASAQEIPVVRQGRGVVVVSTSKGLMTGTQAKKAGVGGELVCAVY